MTKLGDEHPDECGHRVRSKGASGDEVRSLKLGSDDRIRAEISFTMIGSSARTSVRGSKASEFGVPLKRTTGGVCARLGS